MSAHSHPQRPIPSLRELYLSQCPKDSPPPRARAATAQMQHNDLEPFLLKLPEELLLMILKHNHAITGTFVDTKSSRQVCKKLDRIGAEVLCRHKPRDGRFKVHLRSDDRNNLKGLRCITGIARRTGIGMLIPGITLVCRTDPWDGYNTMYEAKYLTAEALSGRKYLLNPQSAYYRGPASFLVQVFSAMKGIQSITYLQNIHSNVRRGPVGDQDRDMLDTPAFALWPIRILLYAIKEADIELERLTLSELHTWPRAQNRSAQRNLEYPQPWIDHLRNLTSLSLRTDGVSNLAPYTRTATDSKDSGSTHLVGLLRGLQALKSLKLNMVSSLRSAWQFRSVFRETFPFRLAYFRLNNSDVLDMDELAGFIARHRAAGRFALSFRRVVACFIGPTDDPVERIDAWRRLLESLRNQATEDTRISLHRLGCFWYTPPGTNDTHVAMDKVSSRSLNRLSSRHHDETVPELLCAAVGDLKLKTKRAIVYLV